MDRFAALKILNILKERSGRIIYGFHTGIEVYDAMQHGGSFPSNDRCKVNIRWFGGYIHLPLLVNFTRLFHLMRSANEFLVQSVQ